MVPLIIQKGCSPLEDFEKKKERKASRAKRAKKNSKDQDVVNDD